MTMRKAKVNEPASGEWKEASSGIPVVMNGKNGRRKSLQLKAVLLDKASPEHRMAAELATIQQYIEEERARINRDYHGETRDYMTGMLTNSVGHMVLSIDYKNLKLKTLDRLFAQFGTTFEEVYRAIRRDTAWQER